jgi:hypothetical protein
MCHKNTPNYNNSDYVRLSCRVAEQSGTKPYL